MLTIAFREPIFFHEPEEPLGSTGTSVERTSGSGGTMRMMAVMVAVVMGNLRSEHRTCNHHQEESCCKQFLHETRPGFVVNSSYGALFGLLSYHLRRPADAP